MVEAYLGVLRKKADLSSLSAHELSYSLRLTEKIYVDVSKKGSMARFCCHSCDGNCIAETWIVLGKWLMKLIAKRNPMTGEDAMTL